MRDKAQITSVIIFAAVLIHDNDDRPHCEER